MRWKEDKWIDGWLHGGLSFMKQGERRDNSEALWYRYGIWGTGTWYMAFRGLESWRSGKSTRSKEDFELGVRGRIIYIP